MTSSVERRGAEVAKLAQPVRRNDSHLLPSVLRTVGRPYEPRSPDSDACDLLLLVLFGLTGLVMPSLLNLP